MLVFKGRLFNKNRFMYFFISSYAFNDEKVADNFIINELYDIQ